MKIRLACAVVALLGASSSVAFAQATSQLPATVPGSGTNFDFDSAVSNTPPYWPLVRLWDGTTKMVVNPNGQALPANSGPVVLPAAQVSTDPCALNRKTTVAFSSSSGEFQLVAPVALQQVFICSITLITTAADAISLVGGLSAACTTGTPLAIVGSTTAANGMDIAANQGWQAGTGAASVYNTTTAGHGVCILQSGTTKVAGSMSYVQMQ